MSPKQAADIKILGSLSRDDLKKLCGDNFPEWVSFQQFEQVTSNCTYLLSYEKKYLINLCPEIKKKKEFASILSILNG